MQGFVNLQQGLRACAERYRSTSLYHRNLGFFFFGTVGGTLWGTRQRTLNEARNADCASVHLTFYELPASPEAQLHNEGTAKTKQNDKSPSMPSTVKRRFEKLWGEAARLLQRQPGYNYTLMFRRVTSPETLDELGTTQLAEAEPQPKENDRRGVGAGLGKPTDVVVPPKEEPQPLDYVEMRVWESEETHQKAQAQQMSFLQKMQELGVSVSAGRYRRVFDDALVRLIQ
ncbi:hypothetical protein ACSSS7_001039 [Eimeria intestinalis]